ncbi:MAG: glycosyltransferase [Flavobacteriales bacterium]|nr:glycosyltransferase [Flavobacteriales bacterium]
MNFLIVTHVVHTRNGADLVAYAPYVNEMNIWLKFVDKVTIIAPLKNIENNPIHQKYQHSNIQFIEVPSFSFVNGKEIFKSLFLLPYIFFKIVGAMIQAHHIHLRCPGNMGLLGSLAQIFFPRKPKTAKYAGNWDPKSKQPLSYTFQKLVLSSTFLTQKMSVLVYGEWPNQTRNIKPFFTATYFESDKSTVQPRSLEGKIHFIFVGSLSEGKQPIYAIQLVESLKNKGQNVQISLYGEGKQQANLNEHIQKNKLENYVFLKGNFDREQMKEVYQSSHFLILPSKSEGWPKVVAEAMFWGCLPISTAVSCVPNMLGFGERGIVLTNQLEPDSKLIEEIMTNQEEYNHKIKEAINWSRNFTIDKFEAEIKKLIQQ